MSEHVDIVAEIGNNHCGDLQRVEQMICEAARAGCDFVKFQTRTLELTYTPEQMAAPRKSPWGETAGDAYRARELPIKAYELINAWCMREGIRWATTCTDTEAVRRIAPFEPPFFKVASPQNKDHELIDAMCCTGRPIVMSTGMSTMRQIRESVSLIRRHGNPLTLLHCTSCYPCCDEELNVRCIPKLSAGFNCPVGFSSHSMALVPVYAAVALGAVMIEQHFTLDRTLFGSDQAFSLLPHGLRQLVRGVRRVERCLGDGVKCVYPSEEAAAARLRRCLMPVESLR